MVRRPQIRPWDPQATHQDNEPDPEPTLLSVVTRVSPPTPAQDPDNHYTAETAGRLQHSGREDRVAREACKRRRTDRGRSHHHSDQVRTSETGPDVDRCPRQAHHHSQAADRDPCPGRDMRHRHPQERPGRNRPQVTRDARATTLMRQSLQDPRRTSSSSNQPARSRDLRIGIRRLSDHQ